ncbi:MAG: ATP-binding protein [Planctomycetota bacterium]
MSEPAVQTRRPFPLTALFTSVSLVAIVVTTIAMVVLIGQQEERILVARGEDYAAQVADHLDEVLLAEVMGPIAAAGRPFDIESLSDRERLDECIQRHIVSFRIEVVVFFDQMGKIIYSTEPSLEGRLKGDDEGFREASAGNGPFSELKWAGTPTHFEAIPQDRDLLEVYCSSSALASGQSNGQRGVLELYLDASQLTDELRSAQERVALITVTSMLALFVLLFFLIRRADGIIRHQTAAIEQSNVDLERLVAERTHELVRAQGQLIEAAQLAAVGTLAAGVAHEINNPLASVAACAEGMLARAKTAGFRDDPDFADFQGYLRIIKDEAYRCKEVTRQLLDLARPKPRSRETFRLQELIDDVTVLLSKHPTLGRGRLHVGRCDGTWVGDPGEIKQVLLNLIQNALDAVSAEEHGEVWVSSSSGPDWLRITVDDNGVGFTPEEAGRLFEPFYTTKEAGEGTGLGLAMSQVIARRHGGRITAESPGPRGGARFELQLRLEATP